MRVAINVPSRIDKPLSSLSKDRVKDFARSTSSTSFISPTPRADSASMIEKSIRFFLLSLMDLGVVVPSSKRLFNWANRDALNSCIVLAKSLLLMISRLLSLDSFAESVVRMTSDRATVAKSQAEVDIIFLTWTKAS